jgi:hypothetical protein
MTRIFQGAGVVSSWRLELPRAVNDVNYGALTDVRLTFYYQARYDPDLASAVKQDLATRPSINAGQRGIPLRWVYPDAFFRFQATGSLAMTLRAADFKYNEVNPKLSRIDLVVTTNGTKPASGIVLEVTTPGRTPQRATTNAKGVIDAEAAGGGWASLAGGNAVGDYVVSVPADANASLVSNGKLDLSSIVNIGLILGYSFTPRS